MPCTVAIFAHQEERRIAACLASLPLDRRDLRFNILVNGSTDGTAAMARAVAGQRPNVVVHNLHPGGKARTWNHFIFDLAPENSNAFLFMDGDAEIAPGSFDALTAALAANPQCNAAAGLPLNGRHYRNYQAAMRTEGGMFGDLYALSGQFVARMRAANIRLPDDLIGDDGLICALAMTDLQDDGNWQKDRVIICDQAGFYCEPARLLRPGSWLIQYRRMVNYSVRHFQNRIISHIMRGPGPTALPHRLSSLYPEWLPRLKPRRMPIQGWFDQRALSRMRRQETGHKDIATPPER